MNKAHQKHAKLARPGLGEWGRTEIALLGAPCNVIKDFAALIVRQLHGKWKIAFADADHHAASEDETTDSACLRFTDKIRYTQLDVVSPALTSFQKHALFNDCDMVLVNGNHFPAQQQIIFIDPAKPLASKLEQLSNVQLVLLQDSATPVPDYLQPHVAAAPVLALSETDRIAAFFENYLKQHVAPLNGLVLTGGKSERMGSDKSLLHYRNKPQRDYVYELIQPLCTATFLSCNASQSGEITLPKIEDLFIGLGPMSGILSAFRTAPDSAWLTVACDMPYLSDSTLQYLIAHRNPSKMATAFMDAAAQFPEPLITIWEPRAYQVLLQALSEGYSCPRKVLIHSDVERLQAPDSAELRNINHPEEFATAIAHFQFITTAG